MSYIIAFFLGVLGGFFVAGVCFTAHDEPRARDYWLRDDTQ